MSLLDGLVNKFKKEVVDKVVEAVKEEAEAKPEAEVKPEPAVKPTTTAIPGHTGFVIGGGSVPAYDGPDDSWYDAIPAEECQYNFGGTYLEYFTKLFREEFPGHKVLLTEIDPGRRYKYTFGLPDKADLVVELMTEKSEANSLRRECRKNGVPYVRFYFDHWGWWNTREYVVKRVKEVLGA